MASAAGAVANCAVAVVMGVSSWLVVCSAALVCRQDLRPCAWNHPLWVVRCRRWLEQFGADWPTLSTGTQRAPHFAALNNVRTALEWCFGAKGNIGVGVGLAAAATPVFLAMSLLPECHRWSQRALLALDDTMRGGTEEMHLQAGLGISSMYTMGSSDQSHAALARGLELAVKLCDPVEQFRVIG
jgi:hypothetical protein